VPRPADARATAVLAINGRKGVALLSKFPALRDSVLGGVALERPHAGRKQAEANRPAAVAVDQ
jgi:hypothetical protein